MTEVTKQLPPWALVLLTLVLLGQSTFIFLDARKRAKYPWLWGMWGLIQAPMPLVVYWIVYRTNWFRSNKKQGGT
ncbi:sigmaY antisigma factor component [Paenibacillus sp. GCM10012303]|jgi:hypothetical protein|uniref:sigmaY antisigma factor component n=1 Tax=Paenibacillus sp. GCM10012303 TaxID=3317340 RepID=UPI0036D2BFAF